MTPLLSIFLPIRLKTPNLQEHWAVKHRRNQRIKWIIWAELGKYSRPDKINKVRFVKIGGRHMDDDNFIYSLKFVRDTFCSWLVPGKAPGQADGKIKCEYEQVKGKPAGVRIEVY